MLIFFLVVFGHSVFMDFMGIGKRCPKMSDMHFTQKCGEEICGSGIVPQPTHRLRVVKDGNVSR